MAEILHSVYFNTGRQYTSQGQRILAAVWDDGVVAFVDKDRLIGHAITTRYAGKPSIYDSSESFSGWLKRVVIHAYDYMSYDYDNDDRTKPLWGEVQKLN